jgi:hypothetical protein
MALYSSTIENSMVIDWKFDPLSTTVEFFAVGIFSSGELLPANFYMYSTCTGGSACTRVPVPVWGRHQEFSYKSAPLKKPYKM